MKLRYFLLLLFMPLTAGAQVERQAAGRTVCPELPDTLTAGEAGALAPVPVGDALPPDAAEDTTPLPALETDTRPYLLMRAPGFDGTDPFWRGIGGNSWWLHEGFNAQLSLSLSVGLGKGAPGGVGFGQSAAFAYALPLTDRLSVAAGIYGENWDWGPARLTDVGFAASVAYRLTDAISLYAYGTKSFLPRHQLPAKGPFPLFWNPGGDRIGAMIDFKLGGNASIQIGVERSSTPDFY